MAVEQDNLWKMIQAARAAQNRARQVERGRVARIRNNEKRANNIWATFMAVKNYWRRRR